MALWTPWFWISSLQNCQRLNVHCPSEATPRSKLSILLLKLHPFSHNLYIYSLIAQLVAASTMAQRIKASACNVGDMSSVPGLGRSPEKEMATHSNTLAWKIPWTEKPDKLQSMGSQRVRHDWATSLSLFSSVGKNLPAMQETLVWYLGWEDPLEEGIGYPLQYLAWRIPWTL